MFQTLISYKVHRKAVFRYIFCFNGSDWAKTAISNTQASDGNSSVWLCSVKHLCLEDKAFTHKNPFTALGLFGGFGVIEKLATTA